MVQVGPALISCAAHLNKVGGLSYGKTAAVIEQMAEVRLGRFTYCRALLRSARKAEPTYGNLVQSVRASPVVCADETGWRIGGWGAWLWAVATVASGITGGCGAGIYCPDAPLTRGQMAVFLATALGLHWPN